MRDTQRKRVYAWEAAWVDWNIGSLKLKQTREIVHWACKLYGVKPPAVKQHSGPELSYSTGEVISFRGDQKNTATACHEAAHHICDAIFTEDNLVAHSPEWLGIYMWLLEGARVAPRLALHSTAAARKLRWVATWTVSPYRLQARAEDRKRRRG